MPRRHIGTAYDGTVELRPIILTSRPRCLAEMAPQSSSFTASTIARQRLLSPMCAQNETDVARAAIVTICIDVQNQEPGYRGQPSSLMGLLVNWPPTAMHEVVEYLSHVLPPGRNTHDPGACLQPFERSHRHPDPLVRDLLPLIVVTFIGDKHHLLEQRLHRRAHEREAGCVQPGPEGTSHSLCVTADNRRVRAGDEFSLWRFTEADQPAVWGMLLEEAFVASQDGGSHNREVLVIGLYGGDMDLLHGDVPLSTVNQAIYHGFSVGLERRQALEESMAEFGARRSRIVATGRWLVDPSYVEITVQTSENYNVGAELDWQTARALAYELLRLTDEIVHERATSS